MNEFYLLCCFLLVFAHDTNANTAQLFTPLPTLQTTVSESDLITISRQLWMSSNSKSSPSYKRLEEGIDYTLSPAGNVSVITIAQYGTVWHSMENLFSSMNETKWNQTAYFRMKPLFDIYNPKTNVLESNNEKMRSTEEELLLRITSSGPMKLLYEWLSANNLAGNSMSSFVEDLKEYWFHKYSRKGSSGVKGSSGWEHVFAGEYGEFSTKGEGLSQLGPLLPG